MLQQTSCTFWLFVSSTFSDLKAERNALQERVFPRLRDLATAHGCRFQAIDLRWGVSEEATLDQQTMKICLGEIARCQKTKLKPKFIILPGDRYGWRPLPYEIPADEFEQIVLEVSKEEKTLLEQWYRRDDNAKPGAVFVLQPRIAELGSVPSSEFSKLLTYIDSKPERKSDRGILEQWYQQGESKGGSSPYFEVVPSENCFYILQPVYEQDSNEKRREYSKAVEIVEQYFWHGTETWLGIEARLHGILEKATQSFPNDARLKYTASATEQEINLGALKVEGANKHVFGFFRKIDNLENLKADLQKNVEKSETTSRAKDFIDTLNDGITYDDKSYGYQEILKKSLKEKR